jgi:hypothetical protein
MRLIGTTFETQAVCFVVIKFLKNIPLSEQLQNKKIGYTEIKDVVNVNYIIKHIKTTRHHYVVLINICRTDVPTAY